ncbi:hypothetical protein [Malikia sp.]|uniref:hypothetical protein n=1 Tax=Malikia sp. TaxID=2070706 RepID=UPI00261D76E0|nr:hypothetical protein [Malikia sp.]MDD2728320.1 hypothetical protein [Malikia sp.]
MDDDELKERLGRIESLLLLLVNALLDDDGDESDSECSLDGDPLPGERDPSMPL